MAVDFKYGRVTTEKGNIPEDEPVFVFRAQDKTLPALLSFYHMFCAQVDSPRHHLDGIMDARDKIVEWQDEYHIQVPRSDSLRT